MTITIKQLEERITKLEEQRKAETKIWGLIANKLEENLDLLKNPVIRINK